MSSWSGRSVVLALALGSTFFGASRSEGMQQVEQAACPELTLAPAIDTLFIRCARVTVPQARGKNAAPDLVPVRLTVVIFSRPETDWKATPVLYLTGGPGESAIDDVSAHFLGTPTGWSLLRERPIVAFDQRGFGTARRDSDPWIGGMRRAEGDTTPLHPLQLQSLLRGIAAGLRTSGVELRNFDTVEAAADAADVLRALGIKRAILLGTSYGTRVALQVLREHEELVEAAVLDGVVPPQATGAFQLDSVNIYRRSALKKLVDDCRSDARCSHLYPTIARDLARLTRLGSRMNVHMRDARTGVVTPATVAGEDLAAAIGGYLIMEEFRIAAPGILAELGHETLTVDNRSGVVPAALRLASRVSAIPEYGLAYLSVVCAESPMGIGQYGGSAMCDALGVPFRGHSHTAPVSSRVPVLLIGSRYDASSPPEWADLAARTLPRAHVVHMPGTGHVALGQPHSRECVAEVVLEFVHDPTRAPAAPCVAALGLPRYPDPAALRAGGQGAGGGPEDGPQEERGTDMDVVRTAARQHGHPPAARPRVGLALGGGSAKGIAHIGVLRWFEEHRIPVDMIAGTSMGGLVGGAFAAGMQPAEIATLVGAIEWDDMFGASSFQFKNVRRKQDARVYPSRIEFGLRGGIIPPVALNNGQGVELLLARIAAGYGDLRTFDDLPTPFRTVGVDLLAAEAVVLEDGFLQDAMRATMSLPGVFPPVEWRGRVLVDGGALDNVPADVVREMGADVVVAVRVGEAEPKRSLDYSISGIANETIDAMMEVNTRRALKAADVVINPRLSGYGGQDWRSAEELARLGYEAAEAMREVLLPLAVGEAAWAEYVAARQSRRSSLPVATAVRVEGAAAGDTARILEVLRRHAGSPLVADDLERDLIRLGGLDRYETISWALVEEAESVALLGRARRKRNAPPFLMLGVQLNNRTSDVFRFRMAARYLAFDVAGAGSELRVDGALGTEPRLGAELLKEFGSGPFFGAVSAIVRSRDLHFVHDGAVIAQYDERHATLGGDLGFEPRRTDELRAGLTQGHVRRSRRVGDPGLPEAAGWETRGHLLWRHDSQDRAVVPSRGSHAVTAVTHTLVAPDAEVPAAIRRSNEGLTQATTVVSVFFSPHPRNRLFVLAGGGTSFADDPLPSEQFQLGGPLRLGAYHPGELRNDHFLLATVGYLWGIARLPDFLGGPVFVGAWLENGSAFDDLEGARLATSLSAGGILDTLLGPFALGVSVGDNGDLRTYLSIGEIF